MVFSASIFADDKNICFIFSKKSRPYIEMLNGFYGVSGNNANLFYLDQDIPDIDKIQKCNVVVSCGTKSNLFLNKIKSNISRIYSFFIYKNEIENYCFDNDTFGVYLYPEPELLLKFFEENGIKKILAPFSEEKVGKYLKNALKIFNKNSIVLQTVKLESFKNFDKVISKHLYDAVWILPDKLYSSKEIIDYLITYSIMHDFNVIGFNRYFFNMGHI
jgi:hypothetical protein